MYMYTCIYTLYVYIYNVIINIYIYTYIRAGRSRLPKPGNNTANFQTKNLIVRARRGFPTVSSDNNSNSNDHNSNNT